MNLTNLNFKANKDLKGVNASMLKTNKYMSSLNKSITSNFW